MANLTSHAGSHHFCKRGAYRLIVGPNSHCANWFFFVSKIGDKRFWLSWDGLQCLDESAAKNVALMTLESYLTSEGKTQSSDAEPLEWLKAQASELAISDLRANVWSLLGDENPGFSAVWQGSTLTPFEIDWFPSIDDAKAGAGYSIRCNLQARRLAGSASAESDTWTWRAL